MEADNTARDTIHFVLNGEVISLSAPPPTLTLLSWLRGRQLCGTKEGCAEGDCGACTVVIVDWHSNAPRYRAINACILFVATLDAKAVITVEHLSQLGSLHPVQRNLVEQHASQCGFCTPGIVMSLFARVQNADSEPVEDALAGNLCRCTGYGPILAAAEAVETDFAHAMFQPQHQQLCNLLPELAHTDPIGYQSDAGAYYAPTTPAHLADVLAEHPDATLLAGGTDVGLWVTKQHQDLPVVVSTGRLSELNSVATVAGWLEIGAACTYSDAMDALGKLHPDIASYLRRIGSTQIRNSGTIAGNLANGSPIGDMPPVLLALAASIALQSRDGIREIALDDFFIDYGKQAIEPGEFIRSIHVPPLGRAAQFACFKVSKRFEQDISALSLACYLECNDEGVVTDARLAYGGMAATPKRARNVENALLGSPFSEQAVAASTAALDADFSPLSDWRASSLYRRTVARNLLIKFARQIASGVRVDLWPLAEQSR